MESVSFEIKWFMLVHICNIGINVLNISINVTACVFPLVNGICFLWNKMIYAGTYL